MTSPATSSPSPAPKAKPGFTPTHHSGQIDKRTIWLSAGVLFGSLIIGIVLMALFADPGPDSQPTTTDSGSPHIIDRPNSGTEPTNAGDRGGAEQLLLLGGIVLAVGGIGFVAFKGGSSAKANRDRWKAAAESGRDGALDG